MAVAFAFGLAVVVGPAGVSGAPATCAPVWRVVKSPAVAEGVLHAVSARTPGDVWAVGSTNEYKPRRAPTTPLTEHWNGARWTRVAGGAPEGILSDVASVSAADAWAVGYTGNPESSARPLIEHWNGKAWTVVEVPGQVGLMSAVSASSALNVWALSFSVGSSEVFRWDGIRWTRMGSWPLLEDIVALSARDVWAVGQSADGKPLALHWNGLRWRAFVFPKPPAYAENDALLSSVTASSANDVWAVGYGQRGESHSMAYLFVRHWNGHQWHTSPAPPLFEDYPEAIAVRAPNDIWVTSNSLDYFFYGAGGNISRLRNNAWKITSLGEGPVLSGLATVSSGVLWAVGFIGTGEVPDDQGGGFPFHAAPLIERYGC